MEHYRTVFVVTRNGFDWVSVAISVSIVVGAYTVIRFQKRAAQRLFGWIGVAFGSLFLFISLLSSSDEYLTKVWAYTHGQTNVVEGSVRQFQPWVTPPGERSDTGESFLVGEAKFTYSKYRTPAPCFHNPASFGGPIHEGLTVRIAYTGECILKLEIADPQ